MISTLSKKHNFDIVFDSQKTFRRILEAVSNPVRTVNINECAEKLFGDHQVFLAVAMTFLDNEVSFYTCDNSALSNEIEYLTLARQDKLDSADFVFVSNPNKIKNVIENAKCGTLSNPHKSATVIIRNDGEPICQLTFSGPGIDGYVTIQATNAVKNAVSLRDMQNYEYPQGIDLIFASSNGELFAIPRLLSAVQ
ncbi:MAG: phosphonate C-P lyase system protein PhnH [Oscillospiraceae bacterium]|jgi:alpha-D-ribose 1-methylphosphonate 5-triphosphate synthase subunit PhnH|nr:phosphonate C-P lyase system protein PhnH [Oscillospiraceae bacterium]